MDIPFKTRMKFLLEDKIGGKKYSKEDYNNGFEPSFECDVEYDFQERGRHYVLIMKFNKIPNGFLCVEDNGRNFSSPDTEVIMMVIGGVLSLKVKHKDYKDDMYSYSNAGIRASDYIEIESNNLASLEKIKDVITKVFKTVNRDFYTRTDQRSSGISNVGFDHYLYPKILKDRQIYDVNYLINFRNNMDEFKTWVANNRIKTIEVIDTKKDKIKKVNVETLKKKYTSISILNNIRNHDIIRYHIVLKAMDDRLYNHKTFKL